MKAPLEDRCTKDVHDDGRSANFHRCQFRAVVTRNGKGYCRIHDPVKVKKKDKAKKAKWDAEYQIKERRWELEKLERDFNWEIAELVTEWRTKRNEIFKKYMSICVGGDCSQNNEDAD